MLFPPDPVPILRGGRSRLAQRRWGKTTATVASTLLALVATVPRAGAEETVLTIEGRGFGHGVGMAQDGAHWMGLAGRSASQILTTFYPGTVLGKRAGSVRVPLTSGGAITLGFPVGGSVGSLKIGVGGSARITTVGGVLRATAVTVATAQADSTALASIAVINVKAPLRFLRSVGVLRSQASPVDPASIEPVPTLVPSAEPPATVAVALPTAEAVPSAEPAAPIPQAAEPPQASPLGQDAGALLGEAGAATTTAPAAAGTLLDAKSSGVIVVAGRQYRGRVELREAAGVIRVTNVIDVEDYLRGMGEILTPQWPAATLQAQAMVARTYALRAMATTGEVCPTQRCQVYLGAKAEYKEMDSAVKATRGKVVMYKGALAATFYSASGGGTIASPEEAFGGVGKTIPYLRAGLYVTGDILPWTVTMRLGEIGRRVGYRGIPSAVTVTKVGPSGRAIEVTVDGSGGALKVGGPAFDAALDLKSTFFTLSSGHSPDAVSAVGGAGSTTAEPTSSTTLVPESSTTTSAATVTAIEPATSSSTVAVAGAGPTGRVRVQTPTPAAKAASAVPVDRDNSTRTTTMLLGGVGALLAVGVIVRRSRRP